MATRIGRWGSDRFASSLGFLQMALDEIHHVEVRLLKNVQLVFPARERGVIIPMIAAECSFAR